MHKIDLVTFLDRMRFKRNFSIEDFTDGIISVRSWMDYKNPDKEVSMRLDTFTSLVNRLGFSVDELFLEFAIFDEKETMTVNSIYNSVVNKDKNTFKLLKVEFGDGSFMVQRNKLLYEYAVLLDSFNDGKIHASQYLSEIKALIDYPEVFKKETHTIIELLILGEVLFLSEIETDKSKILSLLHNTIKKESLINPLFRNDKILILQANLATYCGRIGDYEKCLDLCDAGLSISMTYKEFYLIEHFYYCKALCYNKLNIMDKRNEAIEDCYYSIKAKKDSALLNKYLNLFKKDFNITEFGPLIFK